MNEYLDIDETTPDGKVALWQIVAYELGWKLNEGSDDMGIYYVPVTPTGDVIEHRMSETGARKTMAWLWAHVPKYLNVFKEAWSLVPDMSTGFYFYLSNTGTPFRCRVVNAQNSEQLADVLSGTAEGAICKAWLMWQTWLGEERIVTAPADNDGGESA